MIIQSLFGVLRRNLGGRDDSVDRNGSAQQNRTFPTLLCVGLRRVPYFAV